MNRQQLTDAIGCHLGVGDGWLPLLEAIHHKITAYSKHYEVAQVSEKWGSLHFHLLLLSPEPKFVDGEEVIVMEALEKFISWVEMDSQKICELCSERGRPRSHGWVRTLCDFHDQAAMTK